MRFADGVLLLVLSLFWGSSFLLIRIAVPGFGPVGLVAGRVLLGAALLYAVAAVLRRPVAFKGREWSLLVLGFLNVALPYLLISWAELYLTASFAAVLNATTPFFAALFAARWLSDPLTPRRVSGLIAGVIGVGVIVGWSPLPPTLATITATMAVLLASASYAGAGIYAQLRLHGVPVHTIALGQQLGALAWVVIPGMFWLPPAVPKASAVWAVVAMGLLSTGVAYLVYFRLLSRIGAMRTSTVTYLLPVVGMTLGAVFLDEAISPGMFVGLGIVLGSVVLVNGIAMERKAKVSGRIRVSTNSAEPRGVVHETDHPESEGWNGLVRMK